MIIGIDGNEANVKNKVGVGYFAYNLLVGLHRQTNGNTFWIYLKDKPNLDMPPQTDSWKYIICGPKKMWTRLALPLRLFTQLKKPDVFFSPSHYTPLFSPVPKIVSIMDLGYLDTPGQFTKKDFYQLRSWTEQSIKSSQHIVAISKYCKQDIVDKYAINPSKISILYPIISPPVAIIKKPKYSNYFLYLGTLKPSKNIPFFISGFAKYLLQGGTVKNLVIAGKKGWLYDDIFSLVSTLGLQKNIIFTDYVDDPTKWSLLKYAKALVLPSLFEGFGIPVVEAMYTRTSVIASSRGSLPEIASSYGQIIDPTNENQLIQAMQNLKKPTKSIPNIYTEKEIIQSFYSIIRDALRP